MMMSFLLVIPQANMALADTEGEIIRDECEDIGEKGYGLCLGVAALSIDGGGETLMPYGELDTHAILKARRFAPLGEGNFDLHFEYSGGSSYSLDTHWYGGNAQIELSSKSFVRNLEHLELPLASDNSGAPLYTPDDQDPDDTYQLELSDTSVHVKRRFASYPAHLSATVRRYESEGEKQQMLLNENCTTSCHNVSLTRDVKLTTDQVVLTGDAHAGLVDISYKLKRTAFSDSNSAPVFSYDPIPGLRPVGGPEPHNANPDITSLEHYLNVSTNHTGRVTGYLGLGFGSRENDTSGVSEDYRNVSGRFRWRPTEHVSLLLQSKQRWQQDSDPGAALAAIKVANGMPTRFGTLETSHEATVNYYPLARLGLSGAYRVSETEREDNDLWSLPGRTTSDRWQVGARWRPMNSVKVKASYREESTEDQAYALSATESRRLQLGGSWTPAPEFCLTADMKDMQDDNDDTGRSSERTLLNAGAIYLPIPDLSLSLTIFSFDDDISADLTFDGPAPVVDEDVPYRASGDQLVLGVTWNASDKMVITGGLSRLDTEGVFTAGAPDFSEVGDYSKLDAMMQESSLQLDYAFSGAWDLSTSIARSSWEDRTNTMDDEKVSEITAIVTRRW
jgi:hypothetical protein